MLSTEPVKKPNIVQRNPVVTVTSIVAVLAAILALVIPFSDLLIALGIAVSPELVDFIQQLITAVLAILGSLFITKNYVTPLADPRDKDGEKLTPE